MGDMIDELAEAAKNEWFIPTRPLRDETEGERFKRIVKSFLLAALALRVEHLGQSSENWRNRCLAAEARAEAYREALESVNKLIEWERENGTHFVLIGEEETRLVVGLWTDAKNAVSRALKTAGKN